MYERVFSGPAVVYVEFYDYTLHLRHELFYAVGRERGHYRRGDAELALTIRTSRIFKKGEAGGRCITTGRSKNPELLARYQSAVFPTR